MSPGSPASTANDVFSLGVLLREAQEQARLAPDLHLEGRDLPPFGIKRHDRRRAVGDADDEQQEAQERAEAQVERRVAYEAVAASAITFTNPSCSSIAFARPVALNHSHCAKFCVLGGAACSR